MSGPAHDRARCSPLPASAQAADLYVNPHAAGCSDAVGPRRRGQRRRRRGARRRRRSGLARPGDVVHLASATYGAQLRPLSSGTAGAADRLPGRRARRDRCAPAGTVGVMLTGVHDVVLRGFTVRAGGPAGDLGRRREPHPDRSHDRWRTTRRGGADQGRDSGHDHAFATDQQRPRRPARHEPGARHDAERVARQRNGHDGERYDGDGVELEQHRRARDGQPRSRATATASASSTASTPAARPTQLHDHRATRSAPTPAPTSRPRAARRSWPTTASKSGLFGVVLSDNPAPVTVQYNLIQGRFQHGVLLTTGHTAARVRGCGTTPCSRRAARPRSGNASAVFVASAAQLELRNNLFAYTNSRCARHGAHDQRPLARRQLRLEHELVLEHRPARVAAWPGTARA